MDIFNRNQRGTAPGNSGQRSQQAPNMNGFDWRGFGAWQNDQDRRNTQLGTGITIDAAQNFGANMGNAMGSLGNAIAGNAARAGNTRLANNAQLMSFTNQAGAVPFDIPGRDFQDWMDNNARYQNAQFERQKKQMAEMGALQRDQQSAAMPLQNQKRNDMLGLIQSLMGSMNGGGAGFNGGGLNTNFGASATY